jgi:hypothetical protein
MGLYWGCYMSDYPSTKHVVRSVITFGYEAVDFISHLKAGQRITQAREGFNRDTNLYKQAISDGEKFCR